MTAPISDHHFDVEALGVTLRIDVGALPPVERAHLLEVWSGARSSHAASPVETVTPRSLSGFAQSVAELTSAVTLAALAAQRGRLWAVHAGAVADDQGRVVMFSGRSGMGKTTLMARLAREYGYVTDESVGVTADGHVLPYRKPLSLIEDVGRAKRQVSPARLGLRELPAAPLHLHAVVVLDRDAACTAARLETMNLSDAVGAIAPQCSYLSELEAPLQTMTAHIERTGGALRLRYSESEDALPLIRALLASPARASAPTAQHVPPRALPAGAGYARTPVLDAVRIDGDRLALLRRSADDTTTVHVVDGIGPALWHAADGVSFEQLVAAATRRYGAPSEGEASDAVRSAVDALCAAGLLEERRAFDGAGESRG